MKKLFVLFMVGTLGLGCLTGCGKTEEEKAREEIAQHMREEAEAAGVDLDKEIAQEMAAYEEKHEAYEQDRQQKAASGEEIESTYFGTLDEAYYQYENAEDASVINEMAHIYNDLHAEMKAACEAAGISVKYKHNPIYRDEYLARMAFFQAAKNHPNPNAEMWVFTNRYELRDCGLDDNDPESYESVMCIVDHDMNNCIGEVTIVKNGTEVTVLNIAENGIIAPFEIYEVNGNGIILTAVEHADFIRFAFDFSGNQCHLVADGRTTDFSAIELDKPWSGDWSSPNVDGLNYVIETF